MKTCRIAWMAMALALAAGAPAQAADARDLLPKPKSVGGIIYLTGGVGARERAALRPLAKDYNLRLTFIDANGAFLAFVQVRIEDGAGRVLLDAQSDGPWFFARVPRTAVRVSATHSGRELVREADLAQKPVAEILMQWNGAGN